jgi:hypothetical protein
MRDSSDTSDSKVVFESILYFLNMLLSFSQPNGKVTAMLTGDMNGLKPNTTYIVYLSNGYTKYIDTGWNVAGKYVINVRYSNVDYLESLILTQSGTSITGTSLDTIPAGSFFTVTGGTVIGNVVTILADNGSPNYHVHMQGTIDADGSMSGDWHDEDPGTRTGTWATTNGVAIKTHTGDMGWSGQLTSTVPFTFTTDGEGSGSWHYNFKDTAPVGLSVWINEAGGTLLISDSITF